MKKIDADPFFANLEELGEAQVEENLAAKIYNERKERLALLWLNRKSRERSEESECVQQRIANSAKIAAQIAAIAATIAAIAATVALIWRSS